MHLWEKCSEQIFIGAVEVLYVLFVGAVPSAQVFVFLEGVGCVDIGHVDETVVPVEADNFSPPSVTTPFPLLLGEGFVAELLLLG